MARSDFGGVNGNARESQRRRSDSGGGGGAGVRREETPRAGRVGPTHRGDPHTAPDQPPAPAFSRGGGGGGPGSPFRTPGGGEPTRPPPPAGKSAASLPLNLVGGGR